MVYHRLLQYSKCRFNIFSYTLTKPWWYINRLQTSTYQLILLYLSTNISAPNKVSRCSSQYGQLLPLPAHPSSALSGVWSVALVKSDVSIPSSHLALSRVTFTGSVVAQTSTSTLPTTPCKNLPAQHVPFRQTNPVTGLPNSTTKRQMVHFKKWATAKLWFTTLAVEPVLMVLQPCLSPRDFKSFLELLLHAHTTTQL